MANKKEIDEARKKIDEARIRRIAAALKASRAKRVKIHGNIKCDCGHTQKDHYQGEGWCHHSEHKNPGKCGCTWFHPNVRYIKKKQAEKRAKRQR